MKVKFKEKPNIEENKVNLEEPTLSNKSVIRPVCVCVCVCGRYRQCKLAGPRRLSFAADSALREQSGQWPVQGIRKVRGTLIFTPALVAQTVKSLPAVQETQVQPLGREDPLEKGMATHPSILACRIP